jgi:hypothetical protein
MLAVTSLCQYYNNVIRSTYWVVNGIFIDSYILFYSLIKDATSFVIFRLGK